MGESRAKLVKFKLDGKQVEAPAGTNLIEAARACGIRIPHFCYHPGLSPAGNCRMCLVEAPNSRKPITACTTPVSEGAEFFTGTEEVKKARAGVLEFLLVNHPLDCPICDKSGECMLQDHTFLHGKDRSRMVEPKEIRPTKEVGNDIYIWGNRCIVCTRCVRFCEEISGTGELCIVERGDRSVVDVFPDAPLENHLSGNVVDLCPVGALISKDFLYQARVWYTRKTESLCVACSRGCNIEIQSLSNEIKRMVPRHNPHVNSYWMCDHGRYDFKYVLGEKRSLLHRLGPRAPAGSGEPGPAGGGEKEAGTILAEKLRTFTRGRGPGALGFLASAFMTLEELYLLRKLMEALGVPSSNIAALERTPGKEEVFPGGFKISADKNPNRAGVERLLGPEAFGSRREALLDGMASGSIRGVLAFSNRPHVLLGAGPGEERLPALLEKLEVLVLFEIEKGARVPEEALVLPATAFSEKEGTLIQDDGRVQRLRQGTQPPRGIRAETEVLQDILTTLGAWDRRMGPPGLFAELAGELGLPGTTYKELGSLGIQLPRGQGDLTAGSRPQPSIRNFSARPASAGARGEVSEKDPT
jgi:NADH-quinone oxidoreductase subunit G